MMTMHANTPYRDLLRAEHARPKIYAHRGARVSAPENTMLAFRRAMEEGADGVECDVRLCASGEVVVFHDSDLKRLVGEPHRIANLRYQELRQRTLGEGQAIPLLDDVLDLLLPHRLLNIELKHDRSNRSLVQAVVDTLKRRSLLNEPRLILSSFSLDIVIALRHLLPSLAVAFLQDQSRWRLWDWWAMQSVRKVVRVQGLHPHHTLLSPSRVSQWKHTGVIVNTWTLNDEATLRFARDCGVDGIITDEPARAREILNKSTHENNRL